ncbi:MAG: hypothetical protein ACRDPV_13620 [Gaiellaceae bacterium]
MTWRRTTSLSVIALTVLGIVVTSGAAAPATFPGAAGKLVLSSRGFGSGAELVNPDGSGRTSVPIPGGYHPVWSADGRWLAYSTFPEPWVIRVVRADGSGDREIVPATAAAPATNPAYAWSPSGTEIAYPCATGLCATRVADGTTRRVVDIEPPARAGNPIWSPDGSRIAFTCSLIAPLCMVRPDGSDPIAVGSGSGLRLFSPDWSPDGTQMLFSSGSTIYAFDIDDGEVRALVDTRLEGNLRARWAPDGRSLVVYVFPSIYVVRLDGREPTKIGEGGQPDWGTSPAATVAQAQATPRWTLGRQVGALALSGTASSASELRITLRSSKVAYPPISASVPAGEYRISLRLPVGVLPGAHTATVGGTSGGERLLDVARSIEIAAPASGIVSRAWVSTSVTGPAKARVPRDTSKLFARFEFAVRPAAGQRLVATWTAPSGRIALRQPVSSARVVTSRLSSHAALIPGRWQCRLVAGSTVLAVATIRVG